MTSVLLRRCQWGNNVALCCHMCPCEVIKRTSLSHVTVMTACVDEDVNLGRLAFASFV